MLVRGGIDRSPDTVRILPLGSPWVSLKQLLLVVPDPVLARSRCAEGPGGPGVPAGTVYWEGGYTGYYPPTLPPRTLVLPGPNPSPRQCVSASTGHSRALLALPHTRLLALRLALPGTK